MGRGLPSWHKYRSFGQVHEDVRLGELAVRLGSIVTWDRRGNVVWLDSFEGGLNQWQTGGSGSLNKVIPSIDYCRSSGLSAKLVSGSTGNHRADITKDFLFFPAVPTGIEFSWMQLGGIDYLELDVIHYDGTDLYEAGLRYDYDNKRWEYGDSTTGWTPFLEGWDIGVGYNIWHTFKLVLDLSTGCFLRAIINKTEQDLSAVAMRTAASITDLPELWVRIRFIGDVGDNEDGYCDNVILTQNE